MASLEQTTPLTTEQTPTTQQTTPPPDTESAAKQDSRRRAYVEICVDRSGSMQSMGKVPQQQIAELFATQKKVSEKQGLDIYVSFTSFDDTATTFVDNQPIHKVSDPDEDTLLTWLKPRNTTLLIDTVLSRLTALRTRVNDYKSTLPEDERDTLVTATLYVLTDGLDNQSTQEATDLHRSMTAARTEKSVNHTIFLAANQDAITTASALGFDMDSSMTIGASPADAWRGMRCASDLMERCTSDSAQRAEFSSEERAEAVHDLGTPPPNPNLRSSRLRRTQHVQYGFAAAFPHEPTPTPTDPEPLSEPVGPEPLSEPLSYE